MKVSALVLLILLPCLLLTVTRTVSLDGTQQYTSIQTAINACSNGDIVLVYPGTYVENINTSGKSITINSLYAQNPLQTYIDNTIINGNLNSCIKITSGETVTVDGFTLVNNPQHLLQNPLAYFGGGIKIQYSAHVYVKNCIIKDCIASNGAGIWVGYDSTADLSNVVIFANQSLYSGGGLSCVQNSQIVWDIQHPNSIYNNAAPVGMDIVVRNNDNHVNINLAMGSKAMNAPDSFFVLCYDNAIPATVSITQSYFNFINHDLFISPDGNDNNDGLSFSTAMKTIKHALQVIQPDTDSTLTIYLAPGVYSHAANEQILPLNLKQNVRIVGSGANHTIIDGELERAFFSGNYSHDLYISDISFVNGRSTKTDTIEFKFSRDITLKNLIMTNNQCVLTSGLYFLRTDNIICENLDIGGNTQPNWLATILAQNCRNMFLNGIFTHDNNITSSDYYLLGFELYECDVMLRNSVFANNTASDAYILSYQNVYPENSANNLDMCNVLIFNNNITQCSMAFNPMYLQNRYQRIQINNCTFAGNSGSSGFASIFGYADVRNSIFYNPQSAYELYLRNDISSAGIQADVSISNSLFRTGAVNSDLPNLVTFTDNIMNGNPLFLGSVIDTLNVYETEYYYLSANSPCINTGTPDTLGLNLPVMDLAGNHRIWDGRIDMGCYEFGSTPVSIINPEYPPLPDKIVLSTYPNPVYLNGSKGAYTFIEFTLPEKAKEPPLVEIYNIKGQKVRSIRLTQSYNDLFHKAGLSKEVKTKGIFYSTVYDCKDDRGQKLASGIYLVKVNAEGQQTTGKFTILK